jgi:tetratricopeptide (TPR) repeat protein
VLAFRLALVEHKRGNAQQARDLLQQYFAAHTDAAGLAPYALLTELTDPDSSPDAEQAPPDSESAEPAPRPTGPPSEALLQQLQTLVQEDPDNALLGYFTADALRRAERWEEATTLYQRLLQQSPAADGHQGLVAIYHRNRQVEPLLKQLSEIVGQTGSLLALDEVADALAEDQDLLDELARTVAAQAQSPPEAPSAPWFALALLNAQAGRSDLAVEQFLSGLSHTDPPAGQVAVNLAFHLFDQQQPEKAAEVLQQCADKTLLPERMAEVYFYLAGARALAKDTDGALAAARQAAQLAPDDPRMLSREAWVLFQADQWEAARARYLQILDRFDDDFDSPETREALRDIRMALGALDVERQDFAAAEEWLQQVLDEFPEDIGVYNDLGYLWSDRGTRLQRSLKMVQAAVAAEPENTAYLDSLGWALYRLERYDEAIVYLEKAAADDHGDGVILDHLGDAYAGAGRTDEALAAWRRAAEQNTAKGEDSRRQAIEAKIEQYGQKLRTVGIGISDPQKGR